MGSWRDDDTSSQLSPPTDELSTLDPSSCAQLLSVTSLLPSDWLGDASTTSDPSSDDWLEVEELLCSTSVELSCVTESMTTLSVHTSCSGDFSGIDAVSTTLLLSGGAAASMAVCVGELLSSAVSGLVSLSTRSSKTGVSKPPESRLCRLAAIKKHGHY